MTTRLLPVGLVIAQAFCSIRTSAQVGETGAVFFDAVAFAGAVAPSARLDLYLAVPTSMLSYERDGERFTANYRVHFEVTSGTRRIHDTTVERTSTRSADVVASQQRSSYEFFQHRLELAPGTYDARAEVIDPKSSFVAARHRTLTITAAGTTPLSLSGLLLAERIREDSGGFVMTPRLSETLGGDDGDCFLFFEAYNGPAPADVRLEALFVGDSGAIAAERIASRTLPAGRSQQWLRLDAEGVPSGSYQVELRATRADDSTALLAVARRTLRVEGSVAMPIAEADLDARISELQLVASREELEAIGAAPDRAEKRRRYAAFWSRLDPTPGTARNEAMEQYLSRIDYAKEHFRSYAAGWLTDQGRVYVVYGPPDRIARDPFRGDSRRIETWHYYARGNLELSFEDESGFGDFRLLTPMSPLERYRYGGS